MLRLRAVLVSAAAVAAATMATAVPATATTAAGSTVTPTTSAAFGSQAGDFIGQGRTSRYTAPPATITVTGTSTDLTFFVSQSSNDYWRAEVRPGLGDTLHPGRYPGAERAGLSTGRNPGVDVSAVGRGCNVVSGSFAVNQIAFNASGAVTMADVSLVQHCERAAPALTAILRYHALPLNYKVQSPAGDGMGYTGNKTYVNSSSTFSTTVPGDSSTNELGFQVSGLGDVWDGVFSPPTGRHFVFGKTYPTAGRTPDATHAGLDVSADSSGCETPVGTLRVDQLAVTGSTVTALSITFTQRCSAGSTATLTATLHYFA